MNRVGIARQMYKDGIRIKRGAAASYRGRQTKAKGYWPKIILALAILSGCVADASVSDRLVPSMPPAAATYRALIPAAKPYRQTVAPEGLKSAIATLASQFNGTAGISVRRVDADWEVAHNGAMLMPQQSVSKLWVAMTILDAVDRGKLTLNDPVTIGRSDLTLFHQPLAAMLKDGSYTTDVADLFHRAMTESDNTANDAMLRRAGGSEAVRGYLARRYIANIRFGPGERLLQSRAAGLIWDQKMSVGRNFYSARANLPRSVREKALDDYLASPPDGAAPSAITLALSRLKAGAMLSPASTAYLLSTMHEAKTGPQRVKGGVPAGWSYAHKTGTGQQLYSRSTGYNDVGIMTAPDGTSYAIAVMIASTSVSIPERWELMQGVARAIAANHRR
jgi:beta-lactamase class A